MFDSFKKYPTRFKCATESIPDSKLPFISGLPVCPLKSMDFPGIKIGRVMDLGVSTAFLHKQSGIC